MAAETGAAPTLIHFIDGYIIEECANPFPGTFEVPKFVAKVFEEQVEASIVAARKKPRKLTCELCGHRGGTGQFLRSGRFCSTSCCRAYSTQFRSHNMQIASRAAVAAQSRGHASHHGAADMPSMARPHALAVARDGRLAAMAAHATGHRRPVGRPRKQPKQPAPYAQQAGTYVSSLEDSESEDEGFLDFFVQQTLPPVEVPQALKATNPHSWSLQDVMAFYQFHGFGTEAQVLRDEEVDGHALSMLKSQHLVSLLGMKVGPSLKMSELAARLSSGIG